MRFQLITEYSPWWILVCMLLGIAGAFFLYRKSAIFRNTQSWVRWLLFILRASVLAILSYLLLTPMIRTFSREKEKPVVILAQDNSSSIVLGKDSVEYRTKYSAALADLGDRLRSKYDVKILAFGDRVTETNSFQYNEKQSDYSGLLKELNIRYANRNVGAIVIAGDGLYNRGGNPLYSPMDLKVPVYTVAMGDTVVRKDLLIARVNYNRTVFLGNSFPLEISVDARECNGAQTELSVSLDTMVLFRRPISINGNKFNQLVPLVLDANKKGLLHYTVRLRSVDGELTLANNTREVDVEVLDHREKILVLADAPHPDVAAFKRAMETSRNYEIKDETIDKFSGRAGDYNILVLHNLPSSTHPASAIISEAQKAGIPILYFAGPQTNLNAFNELKAGVNIGNALDRSNAVQASINSGFSLFTISDALKRLVPQLPPLNSPFGSYSATPSNATLFYQQIGSVPTQQPLLVFTESDRMKTAILCGEGTWRWRLTDYSLNGNFDATNELMSKIVQFLSVKENRSHFRMSVKSNFPENEPVLLDAELYNDNYELINTPDISLNITAPGDKNYNYVFTKTDKAYSLNAGFLAPGIYRYRSIVKWGDKSYTQEGEFRVFALQVEQNETVADHSMLFNLAKKNGGEMYYPDQLKQLSETLLNRTDLKTVTYSHYKLEDLVNMKWLALILVLLLGIEWFFRKRAGAY